MRVIFIFLFLFSNVWSKPLTFTLFKSYDFNMDLIDSCLIDGRNGFEKNKIYEIIIDKPCSGLSFKIGQALSCEMKSIKIKRNGTIITYSGRGDCK